MSGSLAGIGPGEAQRWVEDAGVAGPVVFVLAGGVLGLALFPGHVTAAVAGMLFGAVAGTALALAAALLAAALCVVAGRRLGADAVLSLLGPRGRLWRMWLEENGFGAVLACRLAPGTPAGILNYAAGLAGIRLRAILAAVALGALPKTVAYVALGGAISEPLSARGAFAVTLYAGAAACGAVVARHLMRSRPRRAGTPVYASDSLASEASDRPSLRCAGGSELGVKCARRRRVDRLVPVVPLDPVSSRLVAENLADRAGAGRSPRRFRLGDDTVSGLENHGFSFVVPLGS